MKSTLLKTLQYNTISISVDAKLPDINTVAYENNWFKAESTIREVMIALGFQEVMSLMLTNEEAHYEK